MNQTDRTPNFMGRLKEVTPAFDEQINRSRHRSWNHLPIVASLKSPLDWPCAWWSYAMRSMFFSAAQCCRNATLRPSMIDLNPLTYTTPGRRSLSPMVDTRTCFCTARKSVGDDAS